MRWGVARLTAEIVVMNTGGIALASDSAVTIRGRKVYNSADKLFGFSEKQTIGMMIYGSGSMFQVPWETLIKVYENKLDSQAFDTVKEYKDNFLQFLNKNQYSELMAGVNEDRYIEKALYANITYLYKQLSDMNMDLYSEYGELSLQGEIQEMYVQQAEEFLNNRILNLEEKAFPNGFNNNDCDLLFEKLGNKVEELIDSEFESHLFLREWIGKIKFIMIQSLIKDFSDDYSGIVFAGYGDKEIFPSVHILIVDGKINKKTKYFSRKKTINHSTHAVILPFAQRDMIRSFLDGIHEEVEDFISTVLLEEFDSLTDILVDRLKDHFHEGVEVEEIEDEMVEAFKHVYNQYQNKLSSYKQERFIDPILDVVESLPATELAHIAESLLNIASLKRKFSISMETVGGPIDVAVITKGDGFTWVKKK